MKYLFGAASLFLISISAYAMPTKIMWHSSSFNDWYTGCYEVDVETEGKQYKVAVENTLCRTMPTKLKWHQGHYLGDWYTGCYEVDVGTEGKQYKSAVASTRCRDSSQE